jgi:hypothetical protein
LFRSNGQILPPRRQISIGSQSRRGLSCACSGNIGLQFSIGNEAN